MAVESSQFSSFKGWAFLGWILRVKILVCSHSSVFYRMAFRERRVFVALISHRTTASTIVQTLQISIKSLRTFIICHFDFNNHKFQSDSYFLHFKYVKKITDNLPSANWSTPVQRLLSQRSLISMQHTDLKWHTKASVCRQMSAWETAVDARARCIRLIGPDTHKSKTRRAAQVHTCAQTSHYVFSIRIGVRCALASNRCVNTLCNKPTDCLLLQFQIS